MARLIQWAQGLNPLLLLRKHSIIRYSHNPATAPGDGLREDSGSGETGKEIKMRNRLVFAAAIAALGGTFCAQAEEPTVQELMQQIEALKAKVEQLEQKQTNYVTAADVDATVERVLRDADKRSQLFAVEGFTAGWTDGKFILQSGDGNFMLHPFAWMQVRNTTTFREDGKQPNDSDDIQNGFEMRRVKIGIDGNAFTKNLTYKFQWQVSRKDGSFSMDDAWVKYKFSEMFSIRGGQFPDPLAHESLVSSRRFMAAERSFTNDYFSPADNYVQGVSLVYDAKGPLRGEFAFTDGGNITALTGVGGNRANSNKNFQDFETTDADYGVAGRIEYLVMGDWKNYDDYTAMGTKTNLLVIGGGVDYTEVGDTGYLTHTADAQFEMPNGFALYGALYGRYTKDAPAGVNKPDPVTGVTPVTNHQDLYDWGAVAQASYLINPKFEVFGRYGFLSLDSDGVPNGVEDEVHEITVGMNYYLYGHNAKFTIDGGWLPNGAPYNNDGAGILASTDNEFYLRCQFQLAI